ncbi:hypothetical protein ACSZM9_15830 [Aeromonas hydrophila]|uniref:hypothetical protein n=1 Tax=Aeromonas hydrophila TaxID=644 RepID=UPI002B486046|nr:hypothetical protein [Aeromonas hydrophila]
MLVARLPIERIARLLLGLMLVCNLTLCIGWHGVDALNAAMTHGNQAMSDGAMQGLSCHGASPDAGAQDAASQECQMHGGLTSTGTPGLPLLAALLTLLALPLLLLPLGTASNVLDNWLRDPFLRSRGTHPPSWPRRHLMLSVLRH